MDFGKALESVKSGKKIFRLGWNGKGMFVVYQKGYPDGMSNFIFRVKDNDRYGVTCALFEADGGAWKNEAKANIKAYLEKELADVSNIFVIS